MARREHLGETTRKDLGEEGTRFNHWEAQNESYQAFAGTRRFPLRHDHNAAVLCYLTKADGATRALCPQQDIPQMTEEEAVCESTRRGRSNS